MRVDVGPAELSGAALPPPESFALFEPFRLERWFAANARRARYDLARSCAGPITLRDLLALAGLDERDAFEGASLGYGPGDGSHALRTAIAARYEDVGTDSVLVTNGAIEALHLAVAALLSAGDEVVVQDPVYPAVAGLARARGARMGPWPLRAEHGYHPSLDDLTAVLSPRTRLVAITQPDRPMGSVLGAVELADLCALLAARGTWLLSDEVYRDLALEPGLCVPTAALRSPRAIAIGDLGRPFGSAGCASAGSSATMPRCARASPPRATTRPCRLRRHRTSSRGSPSRTHPRCCSRRSSTRERVTRDLSRARRGAAPSAQSAAAHPAPPR